MSTTAFVLGGGGVLGATQVGDFRRDGGLGWVTLADPEGNEFCILRAAPATA